MTCKDCIHYEICTFDSIIGKTMEKDCKRFKNRTNFVEVVRCKDCKLSSEPKAVSRYNLYCNNYDVYYCEKEQKIVCGTHFCGYAKPKERSEENA